MPVRKQFSTGAVGPFRHFLSMFGPPIVWVLMFFSIWIFGCEKTKEQIPSPAISGILVDVEMHPKYHNQLIIHFEDGRIILLRKEYSNTILTFKKGKLNKLYVNNWGDINRVEIDEDNKK